MSDDPEMDEFLAKQHEYARYKRKVAIISSVLFTVMVLLSLTLALFGEDLLKLALDEGMYLLATVIFGALVWHKLS